MKRFVRDRFAPALRELGFKGSGNRYHVGFGDRVGYLGIKRHPGNTRVHVNFTVALAADSWWDELGHVLPEHRNVWWRLPAAANTDELLDDLVSSIREYGLPALQAAVENPPPAHQGTPTGPRFPSPVVRLHGRTPSWRTGGAPAPRKSFGQVLSSPAGRASCPRICSAYEGWAKRSLEPVEDAAAPDPD